MCCMCLDLMKFYNAQHTHAYSASKLTSRKQIFITYYYYCLQGTCSAYVVRSVGRTVSVDDGTRVHVRGTLYADCLKRHEMMRKCLIKIFNVFSLARAVPSLILCAQYAMFY